MIYNLLKRKTFLNLDVHNLDFFPRFFRFLTQSPELSKSTPKQFLNIKICLPSVFLKESFFKSFFSYICGSIQFDGPFDPLTKHCDVQLTSQDVIQVDVQE